MADTYVKKATAFIEKNKGTPFFLYFATHDIHVPRVPHARFAGQSGLGVRGDVILEFDWCVGELLAVLEKHGLTQNTLVIFSSDNGPVVDDGYQDVGGRCVLLPSVTHGHYFGSILLCDDGYQDVGGRCVALP
jgi:arylsulfatase A-like enzyme